MDLEDFRKLAEDATPLFRDTAFAIMKEHGGTKPVETSKRLAMLGTKLHMIYLALTDSPSEKEDFISERIPKLLDWLEALCTWKARSNFPEDPQLRYPNLRNVSSAKTDQHNLVPALIAFATDKRKIVDKCLSRLDKFHDVKRGSREKTESHHPIEDFNAKFEEQGSRVVDPAGRDQSLINQTLYEALCCPCTCSSTTIQGFVCSRHWTRLQLYDTIANSQDKAIFDVVFSSIPAPSTGPDIGWRWQQLRFEIPKLAKNDAIEAEKNDELHLITQFDLEAPHTSLPLSQRQGNDLRSASPRKKKGVRFAEPPTCSTNDQHVAPEELYELLPGSSFCQLLSDWVGAVKKRLRIEGGVVHRIYDHAPPGPNIRSNPSMPLFELLDAQYVSSNDKVVLAYVLARATWQYYSSDFMKVRWTSGTIHFIPEEPLPLDIVDYGGRKILDPTKPYFAFQFDGSDDPASTEFCGHRDVLHRYPRILALAILLTEIGCPNGQLHREPADELHIQINNDRESVQNSLSSKRWPEFGFRNPQFAATYRRIVRGCLNHSAFHIPPYVDGHVNDAVVEQRRKNLYSIVVDPLHQLLSDGGLLAEDTEPRCEGEGRLGKNEEHLQTLAYGSSRYTQLESECRQHKAQSSISCSASLPPAVDTFPSSPARHRPLYTEYTVGWICAVQVEKVAARELLDEDYAAPAFNSAHDNNIYGFGRIGHHKIVIASLPKGRYGIAFAAAAARDMLRSFPSIKFGLMVGIAGGAPSANHDIRLGDIVVSSPDRHSGGVIHYDFGKAIQSKEFQRTGSQNGPPVFLLNAVHDLSAQHECKGHKIEQTADLVVERNPRLKCKYQRPSPETDRLYNSAYLHEDDSKSCKEACDQGKTKLQTRPHRDKTAIHYGLIASADKLMKDAQVRDALAEKEGILCFEMEAAGLMDHFPCLVIRGICDYSDTHKNDAWQGHAAVAAAAYAKELLETIPPTEIKAS